MEEKIYRAQVNKKALASRVIDGGAKGNTDGSNIARDNTPRVIIVVERMQLLCSSLL